MNAEKLKRLQEQVRIGGKGTARRKKKVTHQANVSDDKKMQTSLKKIGMTNIPGIEEVNIIKDDLTVINFKNPKVQASISANTFAMTGHNEPKKVMDLLPDILPQLGQDTVMQLRMYANAMVDSHKQINASDNGALDDDVPMLVEDFDEVARVESEKTLKTAQLKTENNDKKEEKTKAALEKKSVNESSNIQVAEQVNSANVQQQLIDESRMKAVGTSKPKETKKNKKLNKQNKTDVNVIENVAATNNKPEVGMATEMEIAKSVEETITATDMVKEVITEKEDKNSELKNKKPIEVVNTKDIVNESKIEVKTSDIKIQQLNETSLMKEVIPEKLNEISANENQKLIESATSTDAIKDGTANKDDKILDIKNQEPFEIVTTTEVLKPIIKEKIEKNQKTKKTAPSKDVNKESTTKKVDKAPKNKNKKPNETAIVKDKNEVITDNAVNISEIKNPKQSETIISENVKKEIITEKDDTEFQKLKPVEIAVIEDTVKKVISEKEDEITKIENQKPNDTAKPEVMIKKAAQKTETETEIKTQLELIKEIGIITDNKEDKKNENKEESTIIAEENKNITIAAKPEVIIRKVTQKTENETEIKPQSELIKEVEIITDNKQDKKNENREDFKIIAEENKNFTIAAKPEVIIEKITQKTEIETEIKPQSELIKDIEIIIDNKQDKKNENKDDSITAEKNKNITIVAKPEVSIRKVIQKTETETEIKTQSELIKAVEIMTDNKQDKKNEKKEDSIIAEENKNITIAAKPEVTIGKITEKIEIETEIKPESEQTKEAKNIADNKEDKKQDEKREDSTAIAEKPNLKTVANIQAAQQEDKPFLIQETTALEANANTSLKNEKFSISAPPDKVHPVEVTASATDSKIEKTKLESPDVQLETVKVDNDKPKVDVVIDNDKLKETEKSVESEQKQADMVLVEKPTNINAEVKCETAIAEKPDLSGSENVKTVSESANQILQQNIIVAEKSVEVLQEAIAVGSIVQKEVMKSNDVNIKPEIQADSSSSNIVAQIERKLEIKSEVESEKSTEKSKIPEKIAEVTPEKSANKIEIQQKPIAETYAAALKASEFQDIKGVAEQIVIQPIEEIHNTDNTTSSQESIIKSSAEITNLKTVDATPIVVPALATNVETATDPTNSKAIVDKLLNVAKDVTIATTAEDKKISTEKEIITSKAVKEKNIDSEQIVTKVAEDKAADKAKSKTTVDTSTKKPQKNTEAKTGVNKNSSTAVSSKSKTTVKQTEANNPASTDGKKNNQKMPKSQTSNKNVNATAKPQISKPNITANKSQEKPTEVANPLPTETTISSNVTTIAPTKEVNKPSSTTTEVKTKPNPVPKAATPKANSPDPADVKNKIENTRKSPEKTKSQANTAKPKQTVPKVVASTPAMGGSTANKTASSKPATTPKTTKPKQQKPGGSNTAANKK